MDKLFSFEAFVHAVAGTFGGSVTMTTFYPLDIIRTHIQVDEKSRFKDKYSHEVALKLYEEDGIESMYRGLGPTLFSLACSNFVYFYTNNFLKVVYRNWSKSKEIPTSANLLIASIAGCINVITTCPFWVVNTRLKVQSNKKKKDSQSEGGKEYKGMIDGLIRIANEEGIDVLWSGCMASLVLVSNPTIQFVTYDKLKTILLSHHANKSQKSLSSLEVFLLGATAKAISTIITYPIQLAQSKLRHGAQKKKPSNVTISTAGNSRSDSGDNSANSSKSNDENLRRKKAEDYHSTISFLVSTFKREGLPGWFKGLSVKLLQTILMAAFHFLCYERIADLIFWLLRVKKKGPA